MRKIESQFNEWLDYCQNIQLLSETTIQGKRWFISEFLKEIKSNSVEELDNFQINRWIHQQSKRGCGGVTINGRISHLKVALKYFHGVGIATPNLKMILIPRVPELPPRRKFYSQEEIDKVLSMAKPFEWLLISLCYDCGFRISELRNLRLSNIEGQKICFIGKGLKRREVYMSKETKDRLDAYIKFNGVVDYVFIGERFNRDKPLTVEGLRQRMTRAFERAGFGGFYPHSLRHSFATNLCRSGAPMVVAKEMLGHSHLETTERYVHTFEGRLKEYFNRYKFAVE